MRKCELCGTAYAECTHHLIFGTARRKLADQDRLTIELCNNCHNMAVKPMDRIHGNPQAERLSKMLGQALWERERLYKILDEQGDVFARDRIRSNFIGRYGRSYL